MPSGSFLSSSLSCAPFAAEIFMATSETFVAGPIPQPSSLPMRFNDDVAGALYGARGLIAVPSAAPNMLEGDASPPSPLRPGLVCSSVEAVVGGVGKRPPQIGRAHV